MRSTTAVFLALLGALCLALPAPSQVFSTKKRPRLGVTVEPSDAGGLKVLVVDSGHPAAKGGVKRGDVIKSFGGVRTNSIDDLLGALDGLGPGASVELELLRGSRSVRTRVVFPGKAAKSRPGPRSRGGDPLASARKRVQKAIERLGGPLNEAAIKQIRGELRKALADMKRASGPGPVTSAPRPPRPPRGGVFDMERIQKRIQELMQEGASPREIEEAISEEFGGNVKIRIATGDDLSDEEVEEVEDAPSSRRTRRTTSRRTSSSPSSRGSIK